MTICWSNIKNMDQYYKVDNTIRLRIQQPGPKQSQQFLSDTAEINVKILSVLQPVTQQVVLHVSFPSADRLSSHQAILKLYDHRFAAGMRTDNWQYDDIDDWSDSTTEEFLHIMTSDGGISFSGQDNSFPAEDWTPAQKEVFLYHQSINAYKQEKSAYEALFDLQGTSIPLLYADTYLCSRENTHEFLRVPGLLIEFIEKACTLRELPQRIPEIHWKGICDQALATLRKIDQYEVLNEDIRMDNVLVKTNPAFDEASMTEESRYQCFFIDFGHTHLRNSTDHSSDRDWTVWKCATDEEGALGFVVQNHLKRIEIIAGKETVSYPFVYQPFQRYMSLENSVLGPLGEFPQQ